MIQNVDMRIRVIFTADAVAPCQSYEAAGLLIMVVCVMKEQQATPIFLVRIYPNRRILESRYVTLDRWQKRQSRDDVVYEEGQ